MGLFDFLKNNGKEDKSKINIPKTDDSGQKYLGNLDKTTIIKNLCDVPKQNRDSIWQNEFLKNIASASFQCDTPQIIQGPDEMKYFQLLFPEPNKVFECYVIEHMIRDYLLKDGLGVILNAKKSEPDWVLSYGDIVNYSIKKEFITANSSFLYNRSSDEILMTEEKVRAGQPSASIIPLETRKVIREYLESFGIVPKICLIEWIDKESKFEIAFNIIPSMFPKREYFNIIMGSVIWFLPRHYSIIGKEEDEYFTLL